LGEEPQLSEIEDIHAFEATKDKLSEKERELFLNHPKQMAELISTLGNAPIDADIIILQHHELPDGSGFPNKLMAQKLSPLSSLFIIAEDFVHYIIKNPKWDLKTYVLHAKEKYSGVTFKKIISALSKLR